MFFVLNGRGGLLSKFYTHSAVFGLCTLAIACKPDIPEGHFEGSLFSRTDISSSATPNNIHKELVGVDISFDCKSRSGFVELRNLKHNLMSRIEIYKVEPKKFRLSIPNVLDSVEMKEDQGCYTHLGSEKVQICFDTESFSLEVSDQNGIPIYTLTGNRFTKDPPLLMEPSKNLTLPEAVSLAFNRNFDSKIEFQHTLQAKHAAKAAYLNLLPHLSLSTVLSNTNPSYLTLLASIGDVAPFLLPNRWLQAKSATLIAQAEAYTLKIMQSDLANLIEGLAYSLARDQGILAQYSRLKERTQKARDGIQDLEKQGKVAQESTDHINALLNSMSLDMLGLELLIKQDKIAVAQSLGFYNPEAIESLIIPAEIEPQASNFNYAEILPVALSRSYELRQMDFLINSAKYQKLEIYFSWLDPTGDPSQEFGFAIGENLAISQSKIQELRIRREQLQALIAGKLNSAVQEFNVNTQSLELAQDGLKIQERRLVYELDQIRPDSGMSSLDLEAIVQARQPLFYGH